ncbi:MAG: peptidoglycan DD-metalloendopeptidase family protein [Pseudomonadota bacterium]
MDCRALASLSLLPVAVATLVLAVPESEAQRSVLIMPPDEARQELERATQQAEMAAERAEGFAREAEEASASADQTAREAAALAARIQQTEAQIIAAQARYSIAQGERSRLASRLASRQKPLVRLTAALQTSARRPLALSAFQPGSLKDLVYVRAVLDSAVPQIRARTAALRGELEEGRRLERLARAALAQLREGEQELQKRRTELAAIETQQRLASSAARGNAVREEARALVLAEEARDLDGFVTQLDRNAQLRRQLGALPGPVLRPGTEGAVATSPTLPSPLPRVASAGAFAYQLPVQGRAITGFGEQRASGLRSRGLEFAPGPRAQIVAPAAGRIAFSGPYEGFGRIVIIEHEGAWTSLVTGLARADVAVGQDVIGGAPLGVANSDGGAVGIELRQDGEPVNPLDYL